MKVQDEQGRDIGDVISISEGGEVVLEVHGRRMTAHIGREGIPVRPSSVHHPRCNMNCTGDTHYLTSGEIR